jgi:fluoroquinolone transport system permease protein
MMERLASTAMLDLKLQVRYGFVYAAAFTVIVLMILLSQTSVRGPASLMPVFIVGNLFISTFYFIGGMVLFEKGEGVLSGLIVTPLSVSEYLASKVATLTALALLENMIIVGFAYGFGYGVLPMLAGTVITAVMLTLFGFVAVARYRSISEYLMPSVCYTLLLMLPLLDYLGVFKSQIFYLIPTQAPLVLMKSAFVTVGLADTVYGMAYSLLWAGILFLLAKRSFYRYIISKGGD